MNNPFKLIFLIFNLFSATASAVNNNYSQPLPETEFKIGQNVSVVDEGERRKLRFPYLHGGIGVKGLSFSKSIPGLTVQKPCTLSFPVIKYGKYKGFLTSKTCANSDILLGDTVVGKARAPGAFIPEKGLDYTFVDVYPEYWSDDISRKITSSQCDSTGGTDTFIPLLPTPNQPPLNFTVYAYGGESGPVQGIIMDFNATITVRNPEAEDTQFSGLTKVQMDKPYSNGDLGAPVYISLQVPDSEQMVASPVGQVIEVVGEKEQNIWYYIPLDRMLTDSELTIDSGDLSYLLPPNNTETDNVPLSDDLTKESNVSDINNLVERQPQPQVVLTHAGLKMWVSSSSAYPSPTFKQCTLGFAIRKVSGSGQFDHGFLTLGSCMHSDRERSNNGVFYLRPTQDPDRPEIIRLGIASNLQYSRLSGLNYAILRLLPNFWVDDISDSMPTPEGFADIIPQAFAPGAEAQVCATTGYSGHICGTVIDPTARLTSINPWEWDSWIRHQVLGLSPIESWQNLIKVRLDVIPRALTEEVKSYDFGSPVYFPIRDNAGRITQVRPVGIVMDYVYEESTDGTRCEVYMYCVSVYRILLNNPNLRLIGTP